MAKQITENSITVNFAWNLAYSALLNMGTTDPIVLVSVFQTDDQYRDIF